MSYRMRIVLMYKDGTESVLKLAVPAEVGDEIAKFGLVATRVYIDKFLQVPVGGLGFPPQCILDDFKKG